MINTLINEADLIGSEVCFLLEIEYMGAPYRFSTFAIDITDTQNSTINRYEGGLSDPDLDQSISFVGFDLEVTTLAVELIFKGINWVNEWLQGRLINHSICTLSMVTVRNGAALQTEMNKIHLFKGRVADPIFGTPNRPEGYIIFSIQNDLQTSEVKLLKNSFEIDVYKFPNLQGLVEFPKGKYSPFVFGIPGNWPSRTGNNHSVKFNSIAHVSPSYIVSSSGSGASIAVDFLIAGHDVEASQVRIFDQTGGNFRNTVLLDKDADGNLYSLVRYQSGSVLEDNSFVPGLDNDQTFWASWGENDGGFTNVFEGGLLTGGGDLCLYVLDLLELEIDRESFVGLKPILNEYKFAGYANDPEVTALEWLQKNIIEYLPIAVTQGPKGIRAQLDMYHYVQKIETQYTIYTSGEFQPLTGLQPLDIEVVNKLIVQFCYEGEFDRYLSTVGINPYIPTETAMIFPDHIAKLSAERFGTKEEVLTLPFVWDLNTAIKIARDRIKKRGLGSMAIEFEAVGKYGYLALGDVVALNSTELGLVDHKCQVVQKSWSNGKWRFVLHLESNTVTNLRSM